MEDLDLGLEDSAKKAKGGVAFIVFLIGIAVGVAGTLLVPRYLGQYLPAGFGGGGETLEGPVLGKRQEDGRLLLTVEAQQGAALATFTERVAEIDLLVDVGDTIVLGVSGYEPFIDDPVFRGVRKAAQAPPGERSADTGPGSMREEDAEHGSAAGDSGEAVQDPGGQEAADGAEEAAAADTLP